MININFFLITIIINIFIVIFFKKITRIFNIQDSPDNKRKFQKKPIFLIGGTFLIINLSVILIFNLFTEENLFYNSFIVSNREYFAFIYGIISFYIFGLYDDKYNLSPNIKLLISLFLIIFIIFIDSNLAVEQLNFSFLDNNIELRSFSYLFTILCFLLFVNALNMFDGINLQAISYCILLFLIFIFKGIFVNFSGVIIISLIFILYFNHQNKIYLGESGIQILAFIISFIILKSSNNDLNIFFADEIFILMALPGLDMFRLFVMRLAYGKHPFKPDSTHLHHLLGKYYSSFNTFLFVFIYIVFSIFLYHLIKYKLFYLLIYILIYFCLITFLISKLKNK